MYNKNSNYLPIFIRQGGSNSLKTKQNGCFIDETAENQGY